MSVGELDNKSNKDKAQNYWNEKVLHKKEKREFAELDFKTKSYQVLEVDQIGVT